MKQFNRRSFLTLAAIAGGTALLGLYGCSPASAPAAPAASEAPAKVEPLSKLAIQGPMSPPTILLAHLAGQEGLKSKVGEVNFATYKSPDQVRAGVTSGELHVAAVPTYLAANLYNRGLDVRLINVNVWGILHVMTADEGLKSWADLAGKTVAVPFKGDMPDLVFRYLAQHNGLDLEKGAKVQYVSAPTEAMQLLLAGKADAAVLHEPVATAAQMQGQLKGMKVRAMMDLQQEWAKATGRKAEIPQAGVMVTGALVKSHPEVVQAIQDGLKTSVNWVVQNPGAAAELGTQYLGELKAPVIEKSLGRTPLKWVPATEARADLEFFFGRLMELSPDIVGGGLPAEAFYWSGK